MSYNIDTWTTRELRDLHIPLSALKDVDRLEEPELNTTTGVLTYSGITEGFEIRGKQNGDWLAVEHIEFWGEGSGSQFDTIGSILGESTGYLRAILVWEGGDSIERLIVQDGSVVREDIELD